MTDDPIDTAAATDTDGASADEVTVPAPEVAVPLRSRVAVQPFAAALAPTQTVVPLTEPLTKVGVLVSE